MSWTHLTAVDIELNDRFVFNPSFAGHSDACETCCCSTSQFYGQRAAHMADKQLEGLFEYGRGKIGRRLTQAARL